MMPQFLQKDVSNEDASSMMWMAPRLQLLVRNLLHHKGSKILVGHSNHFNFMFYFECLQLHEHTQSKGWLNCVRGF